LAPGARRSSDVWGAAQLAPMQLSGPRMALLAVAGAAVARGAAAHASGGLRRAVHLAANASTPEQRFVIPSSPKCMRFTGGTCWTSQCSEYRGPTECQPMFPLGSKGCLCKPGHCSSAEGLCLPEGNVVVARNVRFENARFRGHYLKMDFPHFWESTVPDKDSLLTVVRLPAKHGDPGYLLLHEASGMVPWYEWSDGIPKLRNITLVDTQYAALHISAAPAFAGKREDQQVVVLDFVAAKGKLIYASGIANPTVQTSHWISTPGVGGYWIPDPPLPGLFPVYTYSDCWFDCGSLGSGASWSIRYIWHVLIYVLVVVFLSFLLYECMSWCCGNCCKCCKPRAAN